MALTKVARLTFRDPKSFGGFSQCDEAIRHLRPPRQKRMNP